MNHFAELTLDLGHIDPDKACKRDCQQEAKITKVKLLFGRHRGMVSRMTLCNVLIG